AEDITKHETILSGDLVGNDIRVNDPCELLNEPSRAENSYHVVTGSRANATALLDGFMITAGYADGWESLGDRCGGGMLIGLAVGGSPIVTNCTFKANRAVVGGGMCNWPGYPKVTDCAFEDNSADTGGGMYNRQGGARTVANCKFSGNWAYTGGGMSNYRCSPVLTNCTFMGNSADGGGGIYSEQSESKLANCVFRGNNAHIGGAMFNSSPALSNCTFTGNLADRGKAVACDSYMGHYPSKIRLVNSILWDGGNEVWNNDNSAITVTYSNIQDGWFGSGNINVDPCFAEPNKDDYHLKSQAGRWEPAKQAWIKDGVTSPCIDAGDPASPIGLEPFPNGGIINMGAYGGTAEASKSYFGKPVCGTIVAGDINGDCIVNLVDFAFMAFHWLEDNNPHGRGDGR
ncbi:MAG: right-handed parallel beta-helix repeat-containing protein, partial [Planctomycetota bacterium]|nr:right-handed parallel beta-helix repeat-containing protein [Planctomycetota bacterium]